MQPLIKSAADQIQFEIAQQGAIPFRRFMELALYCPDSGYYEKEKDTTGQKGDFYTNVSVGSLFGQLLAFQFSEWLEKLPARYGQLQLVEAGAHDGGLAKDVLTWLSVRRPGLFEKIQYCIVEPSARRQALQRKTLRAFAPHVGWFGDLQAITLNPKAVAKDRQSPFVLPQSRRVRGVIFSNELLDAMPVHRLGWDANRRDWFEWGVAFDNGRFVWSRLADEAALCNLQSAIDKLPPDLLAVLPDGFTTEVCPAATDWWRQAAGVLDQGKLLTIDYGLRVPDFLAPQRANGTLRAYHRHQQADDVLANPGEQDLTAHVNYSAIQQAGEAVGLGTEMLASQAQFLTGIVQRAWRAESNFGPWTSNHTRQFQTLTHPNFLGRPFQVLLQTTDHG